MAAFDPHSNVPAVTRSQLMLEMTYELIRDPKWRANQARISLRQAGGHKPWEFCFFGSDAPPAIDEVARGEVHMAIINPAEPLALAERGVGPFAEPIPLRIVTIIPSADQMVFAIDPKAGISSFEEIKARKFPLRYSMRARPDHSTRFMVRELFGALGFTMEDIEQWGGGLRQQQGYPSDVGQVARGEVDAVFDEGASNWVPAALDAGLWVLPIEGALATRLEAMGFRIAPLSKAEYPQLAADVPTLDFSGWPLYTRADTADDIVRACCAAIEACKDRVPWQGFGPLPLERMCIDGPDTPLTVPLHPAAEQFWRERGYLS
jgi:TRAP-type uncharacterized transport system substrate-binding protein